MNIYFNKTIYKKFYKEIAQFLIDAGLSNKERIQGCSNLEIIQIQEKFKCKLPLAVSTFLQIMGKGSGSLLDNINIYSLEEAKEVGDEITSQTNWKLNDQYFPLFHNGRNRIYFITLNFTDETHVFTFDHSLCQPEQISKYFTSWIRELVIGSVELELWNKDNNRDLKLYKSDLNQLKTLLQTYEQEIIRLRESLIDKFEVLDIMNNRITGPIDFQKHWHNSFKQTKQYKELKPQSKRLPWDWIDPSAIR